MSHIIGIDIGTSGIKVGAMNREGNLSFLEYQSYKLDYPQYGWVEIDPKEIWNKTLTLINYVWGQVQSEGEVDALSLSCFCNASIFMDEKGDAMSAGIMYLDQRSQNEAEEIEKTIGSTTLYNKTKNRLESGMHNVTSHVWFQKRYPEKYEMAYKWGNISTYILHKLTGNFVMDWTQASLSGVYDIENYEWSDTLVGYIGINKNKLPQVVDPRTVVGHFKLRSSDEAKVPVIAGGADTACSALALGIQSNEMFESVGTSNVLTVCTSDVSTLDSRFLNRCHVLKNQWLSHGAMSSPGAAIQWFYEQFLKPEGYDKSILETLPIESEVGANGLYFLPYMQGERSPIWDPNARGVFIGLHLTTTRSDMFRSVLEGCSFGLRQIYEIINMNYSLQGLGFQSIGGGSRNRTWAQIKANILNEPIEIKNITETSVLGACVIAGEVIGYFDTFDHALTVLQNDTIEKIIPQKENVIRYEDLYSSFCEIYPLLQTFFEESGQKNHNKRGVHVE